MSEEPKNADSAAAEASKLCELEHALRNNLHAIACGIKLLQRNPADGEKLSLILNTLQKEHANANSAADELFKILRSKSKSKD